MANNDSHSTAGQVVGALAVGAVVAGLGAYFFAGKQGKRNRQAIKSWLAHFMGDVLEQVEKVQELTKEKYLQIVDQVAQRYQQHHTLDQEELKRTARELKDQWQEFVKQHKPKLQSGKKSSRKK